MLLEVPPGELVRTYLLRYYPNHSLRYATHQLTMPIGIVAKSPHKIGRVKSAIKPSAVNVIQKTLRSTS